MCARLFDLVNKLTRTVVLIEQVISYDVDVNISVDVMLNIVEELDNNVVSCGIDSESLDRRRLKHGRLNEHSN